MNRVTMFLWCSFLLSFPLAAKAPSYGKTIPESAWQVENDPVLGIRDAAYIEHYTKFSNIHVKHYRLIRILSEQGKAAAEFVADSKLLLKIRGRVIDRNGAVTEFDRKEDFVDILAFRSRAEKVKTKILIPPGLTSDCIVEMEWTISAEDGLEGDTYFKRHLIPEPYFCVKKVLDVPNYANKNGLSTRYVWSGVNPPITMEKTKYSGSKNTLVYQNVPARKTYPYGNDHYDPSVPFFLIFRTFPSFPREVDKFWKAFTREILKPDYGQIAAGSGYKQFIKALKAQIAADPNLEPRQNPIAAARFALDSLHQRLSATHLMPAEKLAAYRSRKERKTPKLDDCFSDGWADGEQLTMLYLKTIRDLGIKEELVITNTNEDPPFRANEQNPFSLNWLPLVLVTQGEQQAMFCAWAPSYSAGQLPSRYQGIPALIVNPHNKWSHRIGTTLHYGPGANQCQTKYQAALEENGAYSVTMQQSGNGVFNARLSYQIYSLTDAERDQLLSDRWQRRFGDQYRIDAVTTEGDRDLKTISKVTVKAGLNLALDGSWLSINPFPGSFINLSSPPMWPSARSQPIFLNESFYQVDTMSLQVPNGWRLKGNPSWQKSNNIGTVKFVAIQENQTITIQRAITLNNHLLEADAETRLRVFLAWVEEVEMQQIAIAQGGA